MAFFSRQYGTTSPVLTMPPQLAHQTRFTAASLSQPPAQPLARAMPATAPVSSLKRSRDEASDNLEPDVPVPSSAEPPEEEWTYGPGMTLIKVSKGYIADAGSQSGTWLEEKKAAEELARDNYQSAQAVLRNRKSQRMDHSLDIESHSSCKSGLQEPKSPTKLHATNDGPVVDDFTLHLGIGWRRISSDHHIQAAARGWARYIENHYPVTNASILLESKGLQSYLVESAEGFFLFAENLRQGRLVSHTAQGALRNLQTSPPVFDGPDIMNASESPSLQGHQLGLIPTDMEMKLN